MAHSLAHRAQINDSGVRLTADLVLDGHSCRFTGDIAFATRKGTGAVAMLSH